MATTRFEGDGSRRAAEVRADAAQEHADALVGRIRQHMLDLAATEGFVVPQGVDDLIDTRIAPVFAEAHTPPMNDPDRSVP